MSEEGNPSLIQQPRRAPTMINRCTMVLIVTFLALLVFSSRGSEVNISECNAPCVPGDESIMDIKAHGTSETPVQINLRWNCSETLADRICNYNRYYAEHAGYWNHDSSFLADIETYTSKNIPMQFFDSNTGNLLLTAPKGRTWDEFLAESMSHGWPSFRDEEVNWKFVRVLADGETVSINGTHLGHNLPDNKGRRYCLNLVSIAGRETQE